ncbi:MAG: circularly permuted type 2 ATP-grasp protein [Burkholderiaceae bacterium]|nr:circularly permuted type 2 ATP-grasp protein [Burkholderiaceae bacterium]
MTSTSETAAFTSKGRSRSVDEVHWEDEQGRALPRAHYAKYWSWLDAQPQAVIARARAEADLFFRRVGITFNVYGDEAGTERLIPFDLIPRILAASEWRLLDRGLRQRVTALNRFIHDIYHDQEILRAGVIPSSLVLRNTQYRQDMRGVNVPRDVYAHISGIDIVRAGKGEFYVLEDNLRVPSGVSYMIEDRKAMMRLFPELFALHRVAPVEHYPDLLLKHLRSVSPEGIDEPTVAVLTPGVYNAAYFEHAFLAQQMGVELVEGQDLFVMENRVYMKTTRGPRRVDVLYRRIDDDYLDPEAFRPNSVLGVPGLMRAVRAGRVSVCNAPGTGIADDKSIYPYVPDMIRFYLGQEPLLANVPTYLCRKPDDLQYVLDHLGELVVKETQGAGGYGMLVGPCATQEEINQFRELIRKRPDAYIAQPTLALSTCPTFVDSGVAPRHIDLRPFVLAGQEISIVPGGLTRVALREGSLVVNSSQGGGTKDTWVLQEPL